MAFLRRIGIYFRMMFPLHVNGVAAVLMFCSFTCMIQYAGTGRVVVYPRAWFGLVSFLLCLLLPRIFDELKDEGVDDALFPDRPLVTGAVRYADIKVLALVCFWIVIALNLGKGIATSGFMLYFGYLILSWQWWLFPKQVSESYWLLSITHQPLIPLLYGYIYTVYLYVSGDRAEWGLFAGLCAIYTVPMLAWEIARKVRAPEDEDQYLTYTRRWGTRKAPLVALAHLAATTVALVVWGLLFHLSPLFIAGVILLSLASSFAILRFVLNPVSRTNLVKPAVEGFIIISQIAILLEALHQGGVL